MNIRKIIEKRLRGALDGVDAKGDVHAVVAANVGQPGTVTAVSSTAESTAAEGEPGRETGNP